MNKKLILTILVGFCASFSMRSQTLSPTVLPASGGYSTGGGSSLSWTIGQPLGTTLSNGPILTQGVQQPEVQVATGTVSPLTYCAGASVSVPYTASGIIDNTNTFTAQLSDASGSFGSPVNIGTATSNISGTISATIPSNTTTGSGYRIRVTSSIPAFTGTDNGSNITITANVTPLVSLGASSSNICAGVNVTFTATPTNGGGAPTYDFKVNGSSVQTGSSNTYASTGLANGDQVTVDMTANNTCQTTASASSNTVTMTVTNNVTPSVSLGASSSNICAGVNVTFTATPTNGGGAPTYDFKVNGSSVQNSSSNTYASTGLANSDAVTVTMTANNTCQTSATAGSNTVNMTVTANVTPSVSLGASSSNICAGVNVTFTATPTNGGGSPTYDFKVNGSSVQNSSSNTYASTGLANGDAVTVTMTANNTCQTTATANSNTVNMTVTTNVTPSVSLGANATTICTGTSVTFTATPTNGGGAPTYDFKLNGSSVQNSSSATYNNSSLVNGDQVTVDMTANNTCQTTASASSNTVTITVTGSVTPTVALGASSSNVCAGTSVTFTATPTNAGTSPTYNFKVNGSSVQNSSSATYNTSSLANGDQVVVDMTSNNPCQTTANSTSNTVSMTVNTNLTPSVSLGASSTNICAGISVTFTATPTNGGGSPTYDFKVNGSSVQNSSSNTYNSTGIANSDAVTVDMTANNTCQTTASASSNTVNMTVTTNVTPSVSLGASLTTICTGTSVTFTATPTNGGSAPTYNFKVNGSSVQNSSSATYNSSSLADGDDVTVTMTANNTCQTTATANSNNVTMTVVGSLTPSVSLGTSSTTVCVSTSVGFTATPTNGGTAPTYNFKVNGSSVQNGSSDTYVTSGLSNNSAVTVVMTSNNTCQTTATSTSNTVNMTVNAYATPSVSLAASSNNVCIGENVTFTATPTNGGPAPTYDFKINGSSVQNSSSNVYNSNTLITGNVVSCEITANNLCQTTANATSNGITMTVSNCAQSVQSGSWFTPSTWLGNIVPPNNSNITMASGSNVDISLSTGVTVNNVFIGVTDTLFLNNGANLVINGDMTINGGLVMNGGMITFTKPGISIPTATYHQLRVCAAGTMYLRSDITVKNNFFICSGTTFNDSGFVLTVKGNIQNDGTHVSMTNGKIVLGGTVSQTLSNAGSYTSPYGNLEITNTNMARIGSAATTNMPHVINGTLSLTGAGLNINGNALTFTNNSYLSSPSGYIITSSNTAGTLIINGNSSAQQITDLAFTLKGNVTLNRPNGFILKGTSSTDGILTLNDGRVDMNGMNLTVGTATTSNGKLVTTSGRLTNSSTLAGSFTLQGDNGAAASNSLNIDSMYRMTFRLPAGATLNSDLSVYNMATFIKGNIDMNGHVVTVGSTGTLAEGVASEFFGSSGYVITTRNIASVPTNMNIAGMGLQFTQGSAPGNTTLKRGNTVQTSGTGNSIKRYYELHVGTAATCNIQITYDSTNETNGATQSNLRMNSSTNGGSSWNTLTNVTRSGNGLQPWVKKTGINLTTASTLFTLSDSINSPLSPVMVSGISLPDQNDMKLGAWPNPFNTILNLSYETEKASVLQIISMEGKTVYSRNVPATRMNVSEAIDLSNLPAGIYMLTLTSGSQQQQARIIKVND